MSGETGHDDALRDAIVTSEMACRSCSYALLGLPADGRCPECGLPVLDTLMQQVDPQARRLPRIRNPRAVGNALVLLMGCLLVAAVLVSLSRIGWTAERLPQRWVLDLAASAVALLGAFAAIGLRPPRSVDSDVAVRRGVRRLVIGIAAAAVVLGGLAVSQVAEITPSPLVETAVTAALAVLVTVGLLGLRTVIRTIGLRSRIFRNAAGSRQRIYEMIAALWGLVIGAAAATLFADAELVRTIGTIVMWISAAMLLIGLLYLQINCWWIRSAILKPPPELASLLGDTLEPEPVPEEEA